MDGFFEPMDVSDDDEANERERQEAIKRQSRKARITRAEIEEKKQAEEDRYYARKTMKIGPMKLSEVLEPKKILIPADRKNSFLSFIPILEDLFGESLHDDMKKIADDEKLKKHLREWYSSHKLADDEQYHQLIVEFKKYIIDSLIEMSGIPAENRESLNFSSLYNVFEDHKQNMEKIAIDKQYDEMKKEQKDTMIDECIQVFGRAGLDDCPTALREMEQIGIDALENPHRDTSPPRNRFSTEAQRELFHHYRENYLPPAPVNDSNNDDEEEDSLDVFELLGLREFNEEEAVYSSEAPVEELRIIKQEEPDDEFQEDDPNDVLRNPEWRRYIEIQKPENVSDYNFVDFKKNRFEDRLQKKRKVHFADYKSPLNKMRIYVLPHHFIYPHGDDGPMTDHVDLSLSEGWNAFKERNITEPHIGEGAIASPCFDYPKYNCDKLKLARFVTEDWMKGHQGNPLGRFWFPNKSFWSDTKGNSQFRKQEIGLIYGLVDSYSPEQLAQVYSHQLNSSDVPHESLYYEMRRGSKRYRKVTGFEEHNKNKRTSDRAKACGVLIFTDWRLYYLRQEVLINARFQYMPTNCGDVFFTSMTEYIKRLCRDPNLDFHTIIFAFGGSPTFKQESFKTFWRELILETTRSIDVFWMAQDWCDGLEENIEDREDMDAFNEYVKSVFEIMKETGHRNYNWWNIREEHKIEEQPIYRGTHTLDETDFLSLEPLYSAYVRKMVDECNCYPLTQYFVGEKKDHPDFSENSARYPPEKHILPREPSPA